MMLSPEDYYTYHLKGESPARIMTRIRGLKRDINRCIRVLEHPDYMPAVCPSEDVLLYCYREYLQEAKRALAEAGGTYIPTKAEQKEDAFRQNIPHICQIRFTIGGFLTGRETKVLDMVAGSVRVRTERFPSGHTQEQTLSAEALWAGLNSLHLSQWRRRYDLSRYEMVVMDGISWELEVRFSNGTPALRSHGHNAYPYNFQQLLDILGVCRDCNGTDPAEED